jgi:gluconolactonase
MRTARWAAPALLARVPAHEGPVYCADEHALYYTTVPRRGGDGAPVVDVERLRLQDDGVAARDVVVPDANAANGMTLASDGALLVCEQGGPHTPARITRLDRGSGRRECLSDSAEGAPLSSPNDVVETPDGAVWFTDPGYGHLQGFRPRPSLPDGVRRVAPTGGTLTVSTDFDKPNGIAASSDGSVVYVGDSGANHEPGSYDPGRPHDVWRHRTTPGGGLTGAERVAVVEPGYPDGLKVDTDGLVHVSCATGVQVLRPDGSVLEHIAVPGAVNFCFGGPDGRWLFVTNDLAVWLVARNDSAPPASDTERTSG